MSLTELARKRLEGLWGGYDFCLIRERHFVTPSDLVERFLEKYQGFWSRSADSIDSELYRKEKSVRALLDEWAKRKLAKSVEEGSVGTIRAHIMFKQLHYGRQYSINFGSTGSDWKKKTEIERELALYRPWSVRHVAAVLGSSEKAHRHMRKLVEESNSPTELRLFDGWWALSRDSDRPMLFPQVHGHTSGKFWLPVSKDESVALHFDFGFVNVVRKTKILIECDSRRYHSDDQKYQSDRDRQNIAEKENWSVRRFTYEDVSRRIENCFENLSADLYY